MTEETKHKLSVYMKNAIATGLRPHNKGVQLPRVLKKKKLFEQGLPINCKHHGDHLDWAMYNNNVQCKRCQVDRALSYRKRNWLKCQATWANNRGR